MIQYYSKHNMYIAIFAYYEMCVTLNDAIDASDSTKLGIEYYVDNGFNRITSKEFHKAYRQTQAMINSAYSRLNMMETDGLIPEATEKEKRDHEEDILERLSDILRPVHEAKEFEL